MQYYILILICILNLSCKPPHQNQEFSVYKNIKWKILSFEDNTKNFSTNDILWMDAEFYTQKDSMFWNSHHEGADKFFLQILDTLSHPFFYPFYQAAEQDSLLIIAPTQTIISDVFQLSSLPYFLLHDSIIKVFIKIKKHFTSENIQYFQALQKDEYKSIDYFLTTHKPLFEKDTNGIVWLEPLPIPSFKKRSDIKEATVAYTGYFLDGRLIDHTDSLGIHYNDTLQLIEGLNYVIKKLDVGQSAKIILPSRLAFGSRGSFNKTIPPYTPLLYEIKLLNIQ